MNDYEPNLTHKIPGFFALVITLAGVVFALAGQLDFLSTKRIAGTSALEKTTTTVRKTAAYDFYDDTTARKEKLARKQQSQNTPVAEAQPIELASTAKTDSAVQNASFNVKADKPLNTDEKMYVVQVGAFNREADAKNMQNKLIALKLPSRVVNQNNKFLTQAGPFKGKTDAQNTQQALKNKQFDTLIKRIN